MKTIALGMSGGVDSSIAVHLLQEAGWQVIGLHLKLLDASGRDNQASRDAQAVADFFGIPLHLVDAREDFKTLVTGPFAEAYRQGRTPNPCVRCNQTIKFGRLWQEAQALGASHLATGHYARILEKDGRFGLYRGLNHKKDQSYFLYGIDRQVLPQVRFPLGDYSKDQVRAMAAQLGLPVASKSDSQEICFIANDDYPAWLEQHCSNLPTQGQFLTPDGQVLGRHQGAWRYTIGQRKGLGLALGYPAYVEDIDAAKGTVTVGDGSGLYRDQLVASQVNWLADDRALSGQGIAKIRSRGEGSPAHWQRTDNRLEVTFDAPVRAITPGQSVVLYDGDRVLGGGIID
ncbi:tRNA 2-thiouridine(34) synthase MnmA [Peptococcus simiae]|uniref:tRNA-specific 2-thiouridylase MnmA n=1 Tax=Peptococcus simiae TaxID=1643805 RepID=A0ABW9H0U1_9FIRM